MEVIERSVRLGLELVDELTGRPISGPAQVSLRALDRELLPASPGRWFVEGALPPTVVVTVDASGFVPEETSVAVPPVPTPGRLLQLRLKPAVGYPFPPSITWLVGSVLVDSSGAPAPGAEVLVTPLHAAVDGSILSTRTDSGGQFVAWFRPTSSTPPLADSYRLTATAVIDGVGHVATLPATPLIANQRNDAPVLRLRP